MEVNYNIHGNCPAAWSRLSSSDAMSYLINSTDEFCDGYSIPRIPILRFNLNHSSRTVDFYLDVNDESFDVNAYLNFLNQCYDRCDFSIYEPNRSARPVTRRSRSKERQRNKRSKTPPRSRNGGNKAAPKRAVTSEVYNNDY